MEYRLHEDNNYEADRVTAASFRRSLDYCGALWTAQKRFLESRDERLAGLFSRLACIRTLPISVMSMPGWRAIQRFAATTSAS